MHPIHISAPKTRGPHNATINLCPFPPMLRIHVIQSLAIRTDFWGFSIQNAIFQSCRNLPKCGAKSTIFLSNACMNVGSFSMSFEFKSFSRSSVTSLQLWKYKKMSVLVRKTQTKKFSSSKFPRHRKVYNQNSWRSFPHSYKHLRENWWILHHI